MTTSGAELRATALIDEALATALDAGATDRVLARLGVRDGPELTLSYRLAPVPAAELANRIDARFGDPPKDAEVVIADDEIRVEESSSGTAVDRGALRRGLRTLPAEVELDVVAAGPVVTTAGGRGGRSTHRATARATEARPGRRRRGDAHPDSGCAPSSARSARTAASRSRSIRRASVPRSASGSPRRRFPRATRTSP